MRIPGQAVALLQAPAVKRGHHIALVPDREEVQLHQILARTGVFHPRDTHHESAIVVTRHLPAREPGIIGHGGLHHEIAGQPLEEKRAQRPAAIPNGAPGLQAQHAVAGGNDFRRAVVSLAEEAAPECAVGSLGQEIMRHGEPVFPFHELRRCSRGGMGRGGRGHVAQRITHLEPTPLPASRPRGARSATRSGCCRLLRVPPRTHPFRGSDSPRWRAG